MTKDHENNSGQQPRERFGVPEGYFGSSAERILRRLDWEDDHVFYPRLKALKSSACFAVPTDYFEKATVLNELVMFPHLRSRKAEQPFGVPGDFFLNSEERFFERCANLSEETPILLSPEKKSGFTVDRDFFEKSRQRTVKNVMPERTARVIPLFRIRIMRAVAAVLFVSLGIWIYSSYADPVSEDCGTIACVDRKDLLKSGSIDNLENEDLYDMVDVAELEMKLMNGERKKHVDSIDNFETEEYPEEI